MKYIFTLALLVFVIGTKVMPINASSPYTIEVRESDYIIQWEPIALATKYTTYMKLCSENTVCGGYFSFIENGNTNGIGFGTNPSSAKLGIYVVAYNDANEVVGQLPEVIFDNAFYIAPVLLNTTIINSAIYQNGGINVTWTSDPRAEGTTIFVSNNCNDIYYYRNFPSTSATAFIPDTSCPAGYNISLLDYTTNGNSKATENTPVTFPSTPTPAPITTTPSTVTTPAPVTISDTGTTQLATTPENDSADIAQTTVKEEPNQDQSTEQGSQNNTEPQPQPQPQLQPQQVAALATASAVATIVGGFTIAGAAGYPVGSLNLLKVLKFLKFW